MDSPVDQPRRLPLVVQTSNRATSTDKDARLVNGFVEGQGSNEYHVYKRPGLQNEATLQLIPNTARGSFVWNNEYYQVSGPNIYKGNISIGVVDNRGFYNFVACLGATPRLIFGNGFFAYSYSVSTGLVPLGGVQPPLNVCNGWAYVDQTIYYLSLDAFVYGSGLNDPNTWDASNFIAAHIEPDNGIALARHLVYVIALKEFTTEVFYDAGNPAGSPLAPVQGAKINFGCASARSVVDIDGDLYWLGITREGSPIVLKMADLKVYVISPPAVVRLFDGSNLAGSIYAWSHKEGGHTFYVLTSTINNITMAYDINEQYWSQWTDVDGNHMQIVSSVGFRGETILQHALNGKNYSMKQVNTNDDGDVITFDLYTPNFDGQVDRRKNINMLRLNCDRQVGSFLQIRNNDFDYDPLKWTNYRLMDLSQQRPILTRCGTFYRRAYNIRHQSDTPLRITSVDLQIDIGTS